MARVWNNVTNLENLNNRTILQLLQNQNELLEQFALQIEQIEGIANTAVGTANNALNVANSADGKADNAISTASAASSAAAQAVQTANNAEYKVLEYEPQVDGAVTAANQAKQAAEAAQTAANQAVSEVGSLSDTVEDHETDISQLETQVQTAQNGVNQINARESGYGETLSISGNNLSLKHGATTLSTVAVPGGGASVPAVVELTDWSTIGTGGAVSAGISSLTGCYGVNLTGKTWIIWGDMLSGFTNQNNATTLRLVPPSSLGTPSFAAGFAYYATTTIYAKMLQITTEASGGNGINITEGLAGAGATWQSVATSRVESFWAVITFA